MSVLGFTSKQRSITLQEKGPIERLKEIEFNAAFIDTKVVSAIEEAENLLQRILVILGKQ